MEEEEEGEGRKGDDVTVGSVAGVGGGAGHHPPTPALLSVSSSELPVQGELEEPGRSTLTSASASRVTPGNGIS